jgi:hypothetical protein
MHSRADSITKNYVAFTWISPWSNVNKCGCIASRDMNSTIVLLCCEFVMQGREKTDWNKGAWIMEWRWWRGVGELNCRRAVCVRGVFSWVTELQEGCVCQGIVQLGNWIAGGLFVSGDCSVIFIQKTSRDFQYYWDYVVRTGRYEVSVVLFCVCLLKKMLNWWSFTACLFPLTPRLQRKNTPFFYITGYILYRYF